MTKDSERAEEPGNVLTEHLYHEGDGPPLRFKRLPKQRQTTLQGLAGWYEGSILASFKDFTREDGENRGPLLSAGKAVSRSQFPGCRFTANLSFPILR